MLDCECSSTVETSASWCSGPPWEYLALRGTNDTIHQQGVVMIVPRQVNTVHFALRGWSLCLFLP